MPEQEFARLAVPSDSGGWYYEWHTLKCAQREIEMFKRYNDWAEQWPNFCHGCGARGIVSWEENMSPHGSGERWMMEQEEPCNRCIAPDDIEQMVCPRCGECLYEWIAKEWDEPVEDRWLVDEYGPDGKVESWLKDPRPCPFCGWTGDSAPEISFDVCACWDQELRPPFLKERTAWNRFQRFLFEKFGWTPDIFRYKLLVLPKVWRGGET